MPGRNRSYVTQTPKGTARNRVGTIFLGGGNVTNGTFFCSDVRGSGDCAPFTVDKWHYSGCLLHKEYDSASNISTQFHDYVPDAFNVDATWPHIAVSGLLDNVTYATRAAARTNPSRPYVDVPVNIIELADIVRMIRDRGSGILVDARNASRSRLGRHARNVGMTNLAYQFGIAPLVGDLVKLTRFSEQVSNRIQEIKRLQGAKGLRRTVQLDSLSARTSKVVNMQSALTGTSAPNAVWTGVSQKRISAHVRWIPNEDANHLDQAEMSRLAQRAVLGYTNGLGIDLSTLWEVIPWSWLIDWGSDVGDYLAAKRNIIPATLQGVYVMEETVTNWTTPRLAWFTATNGIMDAGSFTRTQKKRYANTGVAPTAHFPFLNGNQVGILASLSVTRRRGVAS